MKNNHAQEILEKSHKIKNFGVTELYFLTSQDLSCETKHWQDCRSTLTSEAVDIMSSVNLGEARLVAVAIDSSDPRITSSTALSRGDDGVAHTPVCQPARTAVVQSIIPGCV